MHEHRFITRAHVESADVENSPVMFHHYFQRPHNLGTGQIELLGPMCHLLRSHNVNN